MRRTIKDTDIRYAARIWALCVGLPCLALVIIGAIACATANGAVTYEPAPEHKCYAILNALGSPPVEVPCDRPTPAPVPPVAQPAPTAPAVPPTATPAVPPRVGPHPIPTPKDHRCFPAGSWAPAPDAVRPCVKLVGNRPEAGAVHFAVSDADGVVRYSGYVNTPYRYLIRVRVVRVAEDGSFTWKARTAHGCTVTASVGNLQD